MNNQLEAAQDIEHDYLAGVFDHLANPTLELSPREGGFGISTHGITISVRQSELFAGLITEYLDQAGANFRVDFRGDRPRHIIIESQESVKTIYGRFEGDLLQIADRLAYLVHIITEYQGRSIGSQPELFLKLYKPWAELHPEWDKQVRRKYTLEFVKSELGVETISETEPQPDVTYPAALTTEYIAGLFDACGRVRLQIGESNDYDINHGMAPTVGITISNPRPLVEPHLKKFFGDTDISPAFKQTERTLNLTITSIDDVEAFLELVGPHIYYNYEVAQLFYEQLIPAYRDGYHRQKEGFLDILRAYESVVDLHNSAKYDSTYFEDLWGLE